jgi:hypothetical protein
VLSQERDFIIIEALAKLGRRLEAITRAEHFRKAYPNSPQLARLPRLLPKSAAAADASSAASASPPSSAPAR